MIRSVVYLLTKDNFRFFFAAIVALSSAVLVAAFAAEMLGFIPCQLCLYQRLVYGLMTIVGIAALIAPKKHRVWLVIVAALQLSSIALSGYHVGIEMGFLPPLKLCSNHLDYTQMSVAQIKTALSTTIITDCSMPSLVILGLSMAGWNLCFSILLSIVTAVLFKFRKY
jgi:disulfide bond formation protein DsbB